MALTPLIAHVVGARPNFMKAAPVIRALADRDASQYLIHTGQHYDEALSQVFFDELGLPRPDVNLGVGSGSHAGQTAALLVGLEETLTTTRPSHLVVYGDINSTLAASLVAAKLGIPIAHVEAGLRSFDRSMPEEVNRIVTDALASVHYVTSADAVEHLEHEGADPGGIVFVGNPMIDTLLRFVERLDPAAVRTRLNVPDRYCVVTLHRPSNVDDPEIAAGLVRALHAVSEIAPLVIPLHPRGRDALHAAGLTANAQIIITEPLAYMDFIGLVSEASLVMTDSGGIQEETTVLGVPCLTLRENTERPVTITHGTNVLVGVDPDRIITEAQQRIDTPRDPKRPLLWDGEAGHRIADDLIGRLV